MSTVTPPSISVVIPLRDRSGPRLDNCLISLRGQDVGAGRVEIILSDLGSDAVHLRAIRQQATDHDARLIETHATGLFNRSRTLNIGIRAARANIIVCTDVDMIFETNFLSTVLDEIEHADRDVLVLCCCWDLPPGTDGRWSPSDFSALKAKSRLRQRSGTGACQAAHRSFFEDVRGYDEKLTHWGFEDSDIVSRARRRGLDLRWISDRTSMLHQWHPRREYDHPLAVQVNRVRHLLTRHVVVKNRGGWGLT